MCALVLLIPSLPSFKFISLGLFPAARGGVFPGRHAKQHALAKRRNLSKDSIYAMLEKLYDIINYVYALRPDFRDAVKSF
jgi:hypothetical protein